MVHQMIDTAFSLPNAHSTRPASLSGLTSLIRAMAELRRQRRALARLDTDQLADLGLTRAQALREAARPFWQLPRC